MKIVKSIAIAAVVIFSGLAIAGPQHGHKGDRNPLMRALHKLDLGEQQKQQIKGIMKSSKSGRKEIGAQLSEGKSKMTALIDRDNPDKTAIEALATEQSQLMKQMILHKADLFSQIRSVLTEEQRAKLVKMREKREKIRGIMLEEI